MRALLLGAMLSMLVAAYSAYAGLKVGGVYWPIVTTSLVSMAVLTALGKTNRNEINIMQTAGSSGGLLAGGIIFTIPAAFMLGMSFSYLEILLISLIGGILGIVFSYPLRKQLIEREKLPCPDGTAAAALIEAGDSKGAKSRVLMYSFGLGSVFSIARDWLHAIPAFVNLSTLKIEAGKLFSFGSTMSLIPFAGGFLIGFRFTAAWFLGAIFTYVVLIPYALSAGLFADKLMVLSEVARPLGVGMVLGSAIAYFACKGIPMLGKMIKDWMQVKMAKIVGVILIVSVGVLTILTGMSLPISVLAIAGAFAMSYVGSRSTAEMNVNPMEIFAMLAMIIAKFFLAASALPLIILAAVVTIAAGLAGDMMQDLKTGYLLKTKLEHQIVAQVVGMLAASAVIGIVLLSIQSQYGIGTAEFPAPQAVAIKEIATSAGISQMLEFGALIGIALTVFFASKAPKLSMVPIAFGIGAYVPIELSVPLFIGGITREYANRNAFSEKWRLVAGGVIAGEGLIGVLFSLFAFLTGILIR
jgi:uncharacterized oligopeptide transporter (OPT) family protein